MDEATKERLRLPFGLLIVAMGFGLGYWLIVLPVIEAQRTGELHFLIKGILFPPACVYMGVLIGFTKLKDGQIKSVGPDGKSRLTRAGWLVLLGTFVAIGLSAGLWALSMGFNVVGG